MGSPIEHINANASSISETEIQDLVPKILEFYAKKIDFLAYKTYSKTDQLAKNAFKELAFQAVEKALHTFLFKTQPWKDQRDVGSYIICVLNRLSSSVVTSNNIKTTKPICPGCKALNSKRFTLYDGPHLRCEECVKEIERLSQQSKLTSFESYKLKIHKVFSLHSRKGSRCPECERFIPKSYTKDLVKVSCLYDNCSWFGLSSELEEMIHPVALSDVNLISLHNQKDESSSNYMNLIDASECKPDDKIYHTKNFLNKFNLIKDIIQTQKSRLVNNIKNIKKTAMYKAYENILLTDPESMVMYLTGEKIQGERPIQSLIFQKYISILENQLPFEIKTDDGTEFVYSLSDPNLELFLGTSEFQTVVNSNRVIHNKTHEIYIGAKCNGPCFIGLLCDVIDLETNQSIINDVEYYSFSMIRMKESVQPNKLVKVVHMRMPPHYEMFSLVLLQRIRKKIVESIDKRLSQEQIN